MNIKEELHAVKQHIKHSPMSGQEIEKVLDELLMLLAKCFDEIDRQNRVITHILNLLQSSSDGTSLNDIID